MAILQVIGVQKDFSGLQVLTGVDFEVGEKERFSVIGPNGAGKTTLFNIISGKFRPSAGQVVFDGRDISSLPAYTRARLGMARSFQITNIFQRLSALDNVLAGVRSRAGLRHNLLRRPHHDRDLMKRSEQILERVGLADQRHTPAQELAYGQQRALEMGVTLSLEPKLVLLDEPTAGMSRQETEEAISMIRRVTKETACVIIEHDMNVVFSLADRISVLHYGVMLACGTPEEIRADQRVKDAYLGEEEE
ncbi:MAG: ABC transporter ATP-binding protein [Desulfarculaceae bacterium]|nr:ABC transporter ATP-binding protein [Desulfarculaceae bacterium]MCF8045932.1 ABC transporter ATP-binding protein [Desulfarculaceae bacterium]MCF8065802.1 ABC transporter ATP-binding protein [Desulfarculaceae bacterium]MCF8098142.1 ABC transporter ATP-binding protein [Desulfarculaceae bacterium]MCF8121135.1 ABC transporter ATP-binding protein [Desulfarculaceae bacterium]